MRQRKIRAVFMRGGTSRALFFHAADLPQDQQARDRILLAALGSPDPYGRQLDGLGGGISSLSKAMIVAPPSVPGADVDYTFAQVSVNEPLVDYAGNCGNCTAAVGPFAIDEGMVPAAEPEATVRLHNTNTKKLVVAHVPVQDGEAAAMGDFELPGVPGKGARIALEFLDPGGAATGKLLPTGNPRDTLEVPSVGALEASLVDATNPVVFIRAKDVGLAGAEPPEAVDGDRALGARLEAIRAAAARAMGMGPSPAVPKIAFVASPAAFRALDGRTVQPSTIDVCARVISMGKCHRAFALTAAMCLAVAARIEGTVVHEALPGAVPTDVRLGHPSGILPINAAVETKAGRPWARQVTVYRTARRLMEGFIRVP
ncbi:MAG TPA: PrpF domain-containing protein [Candidatus Sulfotelmatobacter sp.]|nr:PrpF domain-containing protein [Candidatus Sulfotelmatobacter sp.]